MPYRQAIILLPAKELVETMSAACTNKEESMEFKLRDILLKYSEK